MNVFIFCFLIILILCRGLWWWDW